MRRHVLYPMMAAIIVLILCATILIGERSGFFLNPAKDKETEPSDDKLIVVGISQLGSESVWRTANTESIQNALSRENGYFAIFSNARQKQDNQIKAIRSFISQRVDYIVFSPCTEDGFENVLAEAKDAGIPVILMDRTVNVEDDSLYVAHVGSDMKQEGIKAGIWLEQELWKRDRNEEDINIVILKGTEGSSAEIGRSEGFHEISKKHPNWKILAEVDADFTNTKAKEEMGKLLREFSDIDVVISQNDDMTFGAVAAMRSRGITTGIDGQVIVVSFDACHEALTMVYNGTINVDIECNPMQGEYVSQIIKKLENGESVEKENSVDEVVFTKENVLESLDSRAY